jgi:hydrogenase 3 maturation protease
MMRMSKLSWQAALSRTISGDKAHGSVPRVAVVGVGHELRGDDAAGLAVARALQAALAGDERVLVIDAGPVPENYVGPLRRFQPDVVVLVDAAQMGEEAGVIRWLSWQETDGLSASTHTLSPRLLAQFLISELSCEVALLGVQPNNNAIDDPLSSEVVGAVDEIVAAVQTSVRRKGG